MQCARNFNDATRDFHVAARDHLDEMLGAIPLRDMKAVEVESPCEHEMMGRLNLYKKSFIENEVKLLRDVEALYEDSQLKLLDAVATLRCARRDISFRASMMERKAVMFAVESSILPSMDSGLRTGNEGAVVIHEEASDPELLDRDRLINEELDDMVARIDKKNIKDAKRMRGKRRGTGRSTSSTGRHKANTKARAADETSSAGTHTPNKKGRAMYAERPTRKAVGKQLLQAYEEELLLQAFGNEVAQKQLKNLGLCEARLLQTYRNKIERERLENQGFCKRMRFVERPNQQPIFACAVCEEAKPEDEDTQPYEDDDGDDDDD